MNKPDPLPGSMVIHRAWAARVYWRMPTCCKPNVKSLDSRQDVHGEPKFNRGRTWKLVLRGVNKHISTHDFTIYARSILRYCCIMLWYSYYKSRRPNTYYLTHSHVWVELLIFTRCMHLNIGSYKSNNMGVAKSQVVWSSFTLPIAVLSS